MGILHSAFAPSRSRAFHIEEHFFCVIIFTRGTFVLEVHIVYGPLLPQHVLDYLALVICKIQTPLASQRRATL